MVFNSYHIDEFVFTKGFDFLDNLILIQIFIKFLNKICLISFL